MQFCLLWQPHIPVCIVRYLQGREGIDENYDRGAGIR